jgi:hypothetical protein
MSKERIEAREYIAATKQFLTVQSGHRAAQLQFGAGSAGVVGASSRTGLPRPSGALGGDSTQRATAIPWPIFRRDAVPRLDGLFRSHDGECAGLLGSDSAVDYTAAGDADSVSFLRKLRNAGAESK